MSAIAILSTGLPSVKEKNTLWNGMNYVVKIENNSLYYPRIEQLSSGESKVTM